MSLPKTKWGNCSQCTATKTAVVKVGKELFCLFCHSNNKTIKQVEKSKDRDKLRRIGSSLKSLPQNKELARQHEDKSQKLQLADKLFGDYIKNRDKDKNGQAICPCCDKIVIVEIDGKFNPDCNVMHFIDRDVYLLRFDEDNAAVGHSWCNKNQHYNPKGIEYQKFKGYLIDKIGEDAVSEMEVAHRKINRIELSQLKNIIEHYGG